MNHPKGSRVISGDRPTGRLHLGHYVGSIANRLLLQEEQECHFFIADLHMLTTKRTKKEILEGREAIVEMMIDYLACGLDPEKVTFYLQSACPAIYALTLLLGNLISLNRLSGLPSLKEMARAAQIDEASISYGLIGYPVLMAADILAPKAELVPVGKDNEAHIEITRLIARRFNVVYGEIFEEPNYLPSKQSTLVGTDGKAKMSKSLGNAIYLSDDASTVATKVKKMYTDPNRVHADQPGRVEGNPVFIYQDAFNPNEIEVAELKERYREGKVGDVEVKESLTRALNAFLDPIRERREEIKRQKGYVEYLLLQGTEKMREETERTLREAQSAIGIRGSWEKIRRRAREYQPRSR